jgi:hypothetical protein
MKKAWVSYEKIRGEYYIEVYINGEWEGGGSTGCRNYDAAYDHACKVVKTKGARLERFYSCSVKN